MSFAPAASSIANAISHTPTAAFSRGFKCAAHGCNMAGTLFESIGQRSGTCVYHHAASPHDWPKITQVLTEWECLTAEINRCRSILTNPKTCTDYKTIDSEFRAAAARVEQATGAWWSDLKPQRGKAGHMDDYRSWCQRLELFMGGRVQAATITPRKRAA